MSINLDVIRKKLNQLSGNNVKKNATWRPEEGTDYTIRLLSFKNNDGQPFKERLFYYNIGNNPGLLCPSQFGKPDPIQEFINKLREEGTKDSYELAKKLYPKMRCYAAVIVRGEEDKGPRIWSFGKTVYQALLNFMLDEDYGDITDPDSGRDIRVTCAKTPGKQFADTDVRLRGKSSPLSENVNQAKTWMDNIPEIDEMFTLKTYEELQQILDSWLNPKDDESSDDEDDDFVTSKVTAAIPTSEKQKGKYGSLDDAFADLES